MERPANYVVCPMRPHRVVAHDEFMFTNYDFTRALVIDHQHALHESARLHRLAVLGRRARRTQATTAADQLVSTVHHLPVRSARMDDGETRAAS